MKVLLVDDNTELVGFLAQTLMESSIEVVETTDPAQALKHAGQTRFDGFVVDSVLEGGDGIELVGQLKATPQGRNVPVLIMSQISTALARRIAQNAGCHEFLVKPFSPSQFVDAVRSLERAKR